MGKWIAPDGSIRNIHEDIEDMGIERFASVVLTEENYYKYRKSCNFMFWFQLIGILAGLLIFPIAIYIVTADMAMFCFSMVLGLLWMIIWLIVSMFVPQGKICRKFEKWYRDDQATLSELDAIFMKIESKRFCA